MICTNCNKFFMNGNRPDGTPNGAGFMLRGGKKVTICADCLISLGKMGEKEKEAFMKRIKEKASQETSGDT